MYSGSLTMRRHSISTTILNKIWNLTLTWRIKTYAHEAFGRFPTDRFGRTKIWVQMCSKLSHKIEAWQTFRSESGFDSKLLAFGLKALGRSQDWSAWFFWGRQTAAVRIFVCKIDYLQNRNVYIFSECNLFLILKPILRNIVFGIVKNLVLVS